MGKKEDWVGGGRRERIRSDLTDRWAHRQIEVWIDFPAGVGV
jgi:hypothetical protein